MRALARRFGRALRRSIAITPSHSARAELLPSSLSTFRLRSVHRTSGWEPGAHADLRRPVFADPDSPSRTVLGTFASHIIAVCYFSILISSYEYEPRQLRLRPAAA
jgi:hypothetical protein